LTPVPTLIPNHRRDRRGGKRRETSVEPNRLRRLVSPWGLGLIVAAVATMLAAPTAASAVTTGTAATAVSEWREVVSVDKPSPSLTVADLRRLAENATGQAVRLPDQAAVFSANTDPSWEQILAAAAGQHVPGLSLHAIIDHPAPASTIGDLTNGPTIPQGRTVVRGKIVCNADGECTVTIRFRQTSN
jgi:hypothetical protein